VNDRALSGMGLPVPCRDHHDRGYAFIMWLGEQITERGIGNGISLIIFAGIVARMPNAIAGNPPNVFTVGRWISCASSHPMLMVLV